MIYKSQFKYFKLYKKNNIYYKIQDKGFKIKLNDYTFYVNKNFLITEESTGQRVQTPENFKPQTLQEVEDYLNYIYIFIDLNMKQITSKLNDAQVILENDYYRIYT